MEAGGEQSRRQQVSSRSAAPGGGATSDVAHRRPRRPGAPLSYQPLPLHSNDRGQLSSLAATAAAAGVSPTLPLVGWLPRWYVVEGGGRCCRWSAVGVATGYYRYDISRCSSDVLPQRRPRCTSGQILAFLVTWRCGACCHSLNSSVSSQYPTVPVSGSRGGSGHLLAVVCFRGRYARGWGARGRRGSE